MSNETQSLEEALTELSQMWPGGCPYIIAQDYRPIRGSIEVIICAGGLQQAKGDSLDEAMNTARVEADKRG